MQSSADNLGLPRRSEPGDGILIKDPATRAALLRMVRTSYDLDNVQRQQWASWAAGTTGLTEMLRLPWSDFEPAICVAHQQLAQLTQPEIHAAVLLLIAGQRRRDEHSREASLDGGVEFAFIDFLQSAHLLADESLNLLLQECTSEVAEPSTSPRCNFFLACMPALCLERIRRDLYLQQSSRRLVGAAWMALDRVTASDAWWDNHPS